MKYRLYLRHTETMLEEFIKESDSIGELFEHVKENSIYKDRFKHGWPYYLVRHHNEVRKEIIIGNNVIEGLNLHGTIRSVDDHKYDYIIKNVDKDDYVDYEYNK